MFMYSVGGNYQPNGDQYGSANTQTHQAAAGGIKTVKKIVFF